jgi:hypothetical protein
MQPQLPVDTSLTVPDPEALITTPPARFGLTTKTIRPEVKRIGVTPKGKWYIYGARPGDDEDREPVEAIATPRILDIAVTVRAKTSEYGPRPYLDVTMLGETPAIRYSLSLPCVYTDSETQQRCTPSAVRSLLGCLTTLDLAVTPLKLEPSRGTKANFTNVYLDPEGIQQVRAPRIDDGEQALQHAVDTCRRKLGLPPQFALADAADQLSLTPDP